MKHKSFFTLFSRSDITRTLLTILAFGTLWGATEALFGGLLHMILPARIPGKIMVGIAMGIMAFAIRRTGKVSLPLMMALIAAPLKLFSAVIFNIPVNAPQVLNPAFAILAQGAAFSVLASLIYRRHKHITGLRLRDRLQWGMIGIGASVLQAGLFVIIIRSLGVLLYPSIAVLQERGLRFPHWAFSWDGVWSFSSRTVPLIAIAAGIAVVIAGVIPVYAQKPLRKSILAVGSAACLIIFFAASFLF
ncbi:hypothetical protein LR021_03840 [Candidatus Bipolaricaulota bacterium]|nr:hypothetical protein [Candidatus Bipolaricaulota bacterium]HBR10277.1 hypothetical protein [Candidatus Acetothermia bacterium]